MGHVFRRPGLEIRVSSLLVVGFGERSKAIDQHGLDLEHHVADGPCTEEFRTQDDGSTYVYDYSSNLGSSFEVSQFDVAGDNGVSLDGRPLSENAWSFDEGSAILEVTYTTRWGKLLVTGC
jgi:hypothetical protein